MTETPSHVHSVLRDRARSSISKYRELVVGRETGWLFFFRYELFTTLLSSLPGGLGYALRAALFPSLLREAGRGTIFGRGITLRHPEKIELGDSVNLGDFTTLDAFGPGSGGIRIGDNVLIGRNTTLATKGGAIRIEEGVNIGANCLVYARDTEVRIGRNTLIAAYTYLMGGGVHGFDRTDIPMTEQSATPRGIAIGENSWLGATVCVADGTAIGKECVIGSMSLVNGEIPDWSIAYGIPARVQRTRK